METSIVYKTRTVHSSVRLPEDLHAFAKSQGINLSRTLATLLTAAKEKEEAGTGYTATNHNPIPADPHTTLRENREDTSTTRRRG